VVYRVEATEGSGCRKVVADGETGLLVPPHQSRYSFE
jgi:hypothetical protein